MIRHIIAGLLLGMAHGMTVPAFADPIKDDEFFTPHAQGCMLLRECTDHVPVSYTHLTLPTNREV